MSDVQLIVTGELERNALHIALKTVFPRATFLPPQYVDGVTSAGVPELLEGARIPTTLERFALALVAAVDPGRTGNAPDLVLAVDDIELVNMERPERVISAVRAAVSRQIDRHHPSSTRCEKTRQMVRERCSLHLFSPMVEAYFFGDDRSLDAAAVKRAPTLVPGCDLEEFETDDPAYLSGAAEVREAARHPKRYLRHLCEPVPYRETKQGVAALRAMRCRHVLTPQTQVRFLRAMVADLADALGEAAPSGTLHPLTSRFGARDNVFRNC